MYCGQIVSHSVDCKASLVTSTDGNLLFNHHELCPNCLVVTKAEKCYEDFHLLVKEREF